jgi:signal transduction histidine kinase/integral membrane sensor domain MASE1
MDTSKTISLARRLLINLGVAATYLLLGALGLSLAIAPGYASPIFPAAGFAVASTLCFGRNTWPGVWLGSFALNVGAAIWYGNTGAQTWVTAAAIASGASCMALAAKWLLERAIHHGWRKMEEERDVVRTLLLAGPVASTISAVIGVTALYVADIIQSTNYIYSLWSWWIGDTLGVMVTLPLTLAIFYRGMAVWRSRLTTLLLPTLVAIWLAGAAFYATTQWEKAQLQQEISSHGERLSHRLAQRFIAHQEALSALRRLIEVTPDMNYSQFEYFTRITLSDNGDIYALSYNPVVPSAQRQTFEEKMAKKTGTAAFTIKQKSTEGNVIRADERPDYVAVGFIAPLEGNRAALGFDINSEPIRHDAIERARKSGQPAVTAPIRLIQEKKERVGALLLHPAYDDRTTSDYRESSLKAFAVGVIKVDEMVEIATRPVAVPGLNLVIEDVSNANAPSLLFSTVPDAGETLHAWQKEVSMADRVWRLKLLPSTEYLRAQSHWASVVVGVGGLFLAALLQILILVTTGRTAVVQRTVREQTNEIRAKSGIVEDRNAQLNALFTLSPDAFVAFSPDGRVKFANPAFEQMTGISRSEAEGSNDEEFEAKLRCRLERPERLPSLSTCFCETAEPRILTLKIPKRTVLQVVGIHSNATSVSRILYFRDITREDEVNQMKSDFLAHAAHELRTPLTSIFGFSELLLKRKLSESTQRDLLESIHRQISWLVDIINELLDLSRIESRQGKDLNITNIDPTSFIRQILHDQPGDETRWPVTLELPDNPGEMIADEATLRQAIANMLSNARKYSPDGGIINVSVIPETEGRIGICIHDHGMGMSTEQLAHYGERFWRADKSGVTPGTGLGVSIVAETMKLLGGSINVKSDAGEGTSVTLWLPAASQLK